MTEEPEHHHHAIGDPLGEEADALMNPDAEVEVPPADQMSLMRRLRQPRTILSIVVPLAIIVIAILLNRQYLSDVPADIAQANPWLVLAAFVVYYAGFPLRGWRWTRLLRGVGYKVKVKDGTEILFLSWLVNCIVPAKLGDLYRAYLLKLNSPVSATKTLGTVFMERILDLIVIAALGLMAGYMQVPRQSEQPVADHAVHLRPRRGRRRPADRRPRGDAQLRAPGDGRPAGAAQGRRFLRSFRRGRIRFGRRCAVCPSSA